ncbi:MAG: HAD family hydrolase [Syntrophales bacterium]|nr:HAD family hydrolase [Syntrophales bacterium]
MHFQAVIFDLDGTLLDTLEDIANSANSMLTGYGFPAHEVDAYRYFVGDGVTMLVSRVLPAEKRNDDTIAECIKVFREIYSRSWNVNTRMYAGIPELLDALTVKRVKMAILSNKPDDFTKLCVNELLPNWSFEMILGQRDGIPQKPDPRGAHEIAENLGISPERFLYLGDTGVDMKTAINAKMFPVGALWGFRPPDELRKHGAKALIEQPMELLTLEP